MHESHHVSALVRVGMNVCLVATNVVGTHADDSGNSWASRGMSGWFYEKQEQRFNALQEFTYLTNFTKKYSWLERYDFGEISPLLNDLPAAAH